MTYLKQLLLHMICSKSGSNGAVKFCFKGKEKGVLQRKGRGAFKGKEWCSCQRKMVVFEFKEK